LNGVQIRTGFEFFVKPDQIREIPDYGEREGLSETSRMLSIALEILASGHTTRSVSERMGIPEASMVNHHPK
jgi:hypothetical protein